MGTFAEDCATNYGFTRRAGRLRHHLHHPRPGRHQGRLLRVGNRPVTVAGRKGDVTIATTSSRPRPTSRRSPALAGLPKDGTVTPANSSSISDGAAALVLMRASTAERSAPSPSPDRRPHQPRRPARQLPDRPGRRHAEARQDRLDRRRRGSVEINEAFAVVTMAAIRDLALDPAKVNIHGGACALGHPIGASGARIIVTLLGALKKTGGKRGIASLCIGGGEATALAGGDAVRQESFRNVGLRPAG